MQSNAVGLQHLVRVAVLWHLCLLISFIDIIDIYAYYDIFLFVPMPYVLRQ